MVEGVSHEGKVPMQPLLLANTGVKPEELVCEPEPAISEAEQAAIDRASVMPSGRARVNMALEDLQASSDLQLSVNDKNGLNRKGRDDIDGTLDGRVSINQQVLDEALRPLVGIDEDGVKIKGLRFDPKSSSYILKIEGSIAKGLLWDNFELKIRTNPQGQLYLQVDGNWFPDGSIIDRIKSKLQSTLKSKINGQQDIVSLKLDTRRDGDKLFLTPVLEAIKVPLAKGDHLRIEGLNSGAAGKFSLDASGNLHVNFDGLHFTGSSDVKAGRSIARGKADTAYLEIDAQLHKDNSAEISASGRISLDLDAEDARQISFGGENLGKRVESTRLEAEIDTDVSISADQKLQVESRNHWRFEDAKIQGRRYDIVSDKIEVSLDTQSGLKLELRTPSRKPEPFQPQLSQNVVEPYIDGPAYYDEMLKAIAGARESIEQETFLMYAGDKTQALMRALALKAVGLKESPAKNGKPARLITDPIAQKGIPVRVLFNNNKQNHEGALPTIQQFEATVKTLEAEIQKLNLSESAKKDAIARLHANLKWTSIERGVAKADHRKILLIDGKTGYTGGINMGNHFLQKDSYHDIMLKVNGPAVREMQDAFIDNWKDFSGSDEPSWNRKSVAELGKHRDAYAKAHKQPVTGVDVVTTDERSTEIEAAYLHAIENATDTIKIEQAYYFYPPVQEALKRALARNVSIEIIVPNRSDEELYDIINLEQIRDLMATQHRLGKGEVKAWLYTGDEGKYSHTVHTKALSADGRMAVIGSANLTPRSLRSPFSEDMPDGGKRQVLFNEEMSLYIEGEQVRKLDQQLYETDKKKAIELNYQDVLERIDMLGGEKELQESLLKAQLG